MAKPSRQSIVRVSLLSAGLLVGAIAAIAPSSDRSAIAQNAANNFPDVANHWAQPFITALAERNIVAGYPDGTYRPNNTVARNEFAAIVRQAFSQPAERQIPSGSAFKDVPEESWAAPAIEEAYESGFMGASPSGEFRPQQPISRADALATLAQNLDLQSTAAPTQAAAPSRAAQPSAARRPARRPIALPMASLALLQPFVAARPSQAAQRPTPAESPSASQGDSPTATGSGDDQQAASTVLSQYYTDADRIPAAVAPGVADATRTGIVVNHPNLRVLNPTQPATRGDVAAFVHQALVNIGKIEPLPQNQAATQYIVNREAVNREAN
ncbi:S-layer homology domain-containing protein [Myxacorys almedinensis]|uniref:S-layer homology domain-containing protein n=1 Tax=Myxacorys almedinensis A TaxID=2690445 RepID=A0A8J7Z9Z2_9CYAN|nr:S-layer homology domain-containing protein [Myxacorys almedinensis]NDJ18135.1 S-layer homology domain-containing protein [Myxacorys almedinensis A]